MTDKTGKEISHFFKYRILKNSDHTPGSTNPKPLFRDGNTCKVKSGNKKLPREYKQLLKNHDVNYYSMHTGLQIDIHRE
jgi:hypothetical protein